MMAFLGLAKVRRARSIIFLLLLTFSSYVLASDSQISNFIGYRSRRCPPVFKAQDRVERKLAAVSPDSAISGNAPVPSPSNPLPPSPPPNKRPALISPSGNSPGSDLPPKLRTPPPAGSRPSAPEAPITSPASSSKRSNLAVVLGVTLGVLVLLLVSLSAAAFFRPDWLPCCKGHSRRSTQYERHLPT